MYIYYLTWSVSIAIIAYNIGNRLGLIDTIHNPIETIIARFVIPMFGISFFAWRNENKK
jgi:hypothetical protein